MTTGEEHPKSSTKHFWSNRGRSITNSLPLHLATPIPLIEALTYQGLYPAYPYGSVFFAGHPFQVGFQGSQSESHCKMAD